MILLLSAAMLGAVGADASAGAQPSQGFIVCPGDPRCPTGGRRPPQGFIICPGDRRCPTSVVPRPVPICPPGAYSDPATGSCVAPIVPSPVYRDCPDGSRVQEGQNCPPPIAPPTGPFMVYFGWDNATLTAEARAVLDEVAEAAQLSPGLITLSAHTDRRGSAQYNIGLSQRYANAVRDYLIARGVAAGRIRTEAYGEARPLVQTADGVREPQNRRVEIAFTPNSGW